MKVIKITEATSSWGLRAEPEDYDSVPRISTALFDRQPRILSPDRVALASYLLFGQNCSGRLEIPQWLSPALAEAISRDALPTWLHVVPVELYAKALPIGSRAMHLRLEGVTGFEPHPDDPPEVLRFMRSDRSRGARFTFKSLEVSSNVWLFPTSDDEGRVRAALACALIFAEDLELDLCIVPKGAASVEALTRLRQLVNTVRLDVVEA